MCVYKSWNLEYDAREMTAVTNECCTGWLKIAIWWGRNETFNLDIFLMRKMSTFFGAG